ncbi:uncharacterized protein TRAVEDRAFT_24438 [Trametes versicolor FP-101664 SS1]|uniref:uncharacterized protein n=1 Tax=Trametes versicolor (strain FP-101664) TaxID=717944 RepID=UPI00046212A1|nr:uncharacterized protein TRAVEDRAFT_24438 [Trametes versicolor FP-101664 SS1]EIW53135.1 hypothetical protein TRAVEDRAFT_24438 [Trametes versicolor FP-101664 SS1]
MNTTTATTTSLADLSFIEAQNLNTTEKYFYLGTAAAVLLLYDFLLTIGVEHACFWRRRLSGAAALFLVNRYLTLFLALYNAPWWDVLQLQYSGATRCTTVAFVQAFFLNSQYVIWAVFNCLRVFALQRPRWRCTAIVLILSLTAVAADVVQLPSVHSTLDRAPLSAGCAARDKTPLQGFYSAEISVCMLLIAAELLVMAVTWAEMAHYRASARRVRRALTLSCVLYENGRAYFVSVTLMHTLHLLSPLLSVRIHWDPTLVTLVPPLTLKIIAILVNRFLLALQAAASASAPHPDDTFLDSNLECDSASLLQFVRADIDEWIQSELDFASPSSLDDGASTDSLDGEDRARWDEECGAALRRGGSAGRGDGEV